MKQLLLFSLLVMLFQSDCRSNGVASDRLARPQISSCDAWQSVVNSLPQEKRDFLQKNGGLLAPEHVPSLLVIDKTVLRDCGLRSQMSEYFGRVLFDDHNDADNLADREFAREHSKDIVEVLRRIWESLSGSKALRADGNFSDLKYALLADPAFSESDIGPLISDILDAETIDQPLATIIFLRPMPDLLKPAMQRLQARAEMPSSLDPETRRIWQILNLTILAKMGDQSVLPKLKRLERDRSLTGASRTIVKRVITKIEKGQDLQFSDIEELEH